jgi:ABC-type transport system substrate-binding protein
LLEFFKSSDVFVNEKPKISKTTISTNGLSTCLFFLMKFRLNDHPYAFLVHHEKLCNPKMSAPQLFVHLLNDIVYYVKDILHEDFYFKESFNFTDIKNINLLVGGGTPTENNNIRQAFGLLINRDQLISNILLDLFKENEDCQYLINNLFNNTKILNATSYLQSTEELNEERSKFYFLLI